mmetsp:Transcript_34664/g.78219  ORF Transcript_34664/g.78219 Transcript_34664/m.78219 type:complete len:220 (-) Transcript_34664:800-1459(-)
MGSTRLGRRSDASPASTSPAPPAPSARAAAAAAQAPAWPAPTASTRPTRTACGTSSSARPALSPPVAPSSSWPTASSSLPAPAETCSACRSASSSSATPSPLPPPPLSFLSKSLRRSPATVHWESRRRGWETGSLRWERTWTRGRAAGTREPSTSSTSRALRPCSRASTAPRPHLRPPAAMASAFPSPPTPRRLRVPSGCWWGRRSERVSTSPRGAFGL